MDIQAEKLYLIEQPARLPDAGMIKQVKELLQGLSKDKALRGLLKTPVYPKDSFGKF